MTLGLAELLLLSIPGLTRRRGGRLRWGKLQRWTDLEASRDSSPSPRSLPHLNIVEVEPAPLVPVHLTRLDWDTTTTSTQPPQVSRQFMLTQGIDDPRHLALVVVSAPNVPLQRPNGNRWQRLDPTRMARGMCGNGEDRRCRNFLATFPAMGLY